MIRTRTRTLIRTLAWGTGLAVVLVASAAAQPAPPSRAHRDRVLDQAAQSGGAARRAAAPELQAAVDRALIDKYCVTCHNSQLKTAGLALDGIDMSQAAAHAEVLEKVVRKLRTGQTPPAGRPRPAADAREAFVAARDSTLDAAG